MELHLHRRIPRLSGAIDDGYGAELRIGAGMRRKRSDGWQVRVIPGLQTRLILADEVQLQDGTLIPHRLLNAQRSVPHVRDIEIRTGQVQGSPAFRQSVL